MATLQTQYQNYLKKNPHISYDEWLDELSKRFLTIIKHDEPKVSDDFQIGPNGAYEYSDRDIEFKNVLHSISLKLDKVEYNNGDISDIGNEVGAAIGTLIPDMTDNEISMFISGFKHGVSLTNGTH
jgi:hypothetical protein